MDGDHHQAIYMDTILNFLSEAVDIVHSYAREVCTVLLVAALLAAGNYLLHATQCSQDGQRTVITDIIQGHGPATNAPAMKSCAWLKTNGTNTLCASDEDLH